MNVCVHSLVQVEAMHDFDAENTDELNLKMGDLVFVIPTKQTADQVRNLHPFRCPIHPHHQQAYKRDKETTLPTTLLQRLIQEGKGNIVS